MIIVHQADERTMIPDVIRYSVDALRWIVNAHYASLGVEVARRSDYVQRKSFNGDERDAPHHDESKAAPGCRDPG